MEEFLDHTAIVLLVCYSVFVVIGILGSDDDR